MANADKDDRADRDRRTGARRQKTPRKATEEYLRNAALYHLGRFAASRASVRQALMRRVAASAQAHGTDPADGARIVDQVLDRLEALGVIDDRAYAAGRAASLLRQGKSTRLARGKLAEKGIAAEVIDTALAEIAQDRPEPDKAAALALARRRRLGPYRPAESRRDHYRRDMAALARSGFSAEIARWVLDAADPTALEDELAAVDP